MYLVVTAHSCCLHRLALADLVNHDGRWRSSHV